MFYFGLKEKIVFFLFFFRIAKIHGQPVVFNPVSSVLSPVVLSGAGAAPLAGDGRRSLWYGSVPRLVILEAN